MLLAAQLSRTTLGDVLGQLHRARASGMLVLEEIVGSRAGISHAVHVVSGSPRAVDSEGPRLGELLATRGGVDVNRVEEGVRRKHRGDARLMGEVLCDLGSAPEIISRVLEEQTRARLESLYGLTDARIRFHAALFDDVAPRTWVKAARGAKSLSPTDFLHGRPRARARSRSASEDRHDDHRIIGVRPDADPRTLREAFKRRVLELHPDRASNDEDRAVRTRELARLLAAYQRITG